MSDKRVLLLILLFIILSGCSNYKQLNEVAIIVGMGVDYIPKKDVYEVTFQAINPSANAMQIGNSKATPVVSYKATGKTISEAARNSSKQISRQNIYSHVALVVIGETLAAKESLNFVFDVFERDAKVRVNVPVLIARNARVHEVMDILPSLDKVPMVSLIGRIKNTSKLLGEHGEVKIYQIISALASKGREPAVSGISVKGNKKIGTTNANVERMENTFAVLNGVGIFKKGKLVGWLEGKKTKSIQIVNNTLKQTNLSIPCNKKKDNSVQVKSAHSDVKVDMDHSQAIIHIRTHVNATLDEILCNKNINDYKVIKEFEHEAEQEFKKETYDGIVSAQMMESDVFGFGDILHRTHPVKWKKQKQHWDQIFSKAKVYIDVDVNIEGTGMRVRPYPY
ncbi:Ger(x)C family spore germination protein [Bacillus sp. S14(2024)]|uniref:Ger(x)C family spore germination protein n=1 Tax=Bacillus sp. S14(2024) TaxID=3162884 RepID=UPI003D2307A6